MPQVGGTGPKSGFNQCRDHILNGLAGSGRRQSLIKAQAHPGGGTEGGVEGFDKLGVFGKVLRQDFEHGVA